MVTATSLKSDFSQSLGAQGWTGGTCICSHCLLKSISYGSWAMQRERITWIPLRAAHKSQVRNLVQVRATLASTSFMHKHRPSEQTFPCGTHHASRACQQRAKTEMKECTALQIQKAHTLASLGKLCTKAPTG